jgi:hypothetical protein
MDSDLPYMDHQTDSFSSMKRDQARAPKDSSVQYIHLPYEASRWQRIWLF